MSFPLVSANPRVSIVLAAFGAAVLATKVVQVLVGYLTW